MWSGDLKASLRIVAKKSIHKTQSSAPAVVQVGNVVKTNKNLRGGDEECDGKMFLLPSLQIFVPFEFLNLL